MIQAIADELVLRKSELSETVETIYFGGGTPSLLSVDELQFLMDVIHDNYRVIEDPEITLEANPDDLSKEKIIHLSKSPINRLSIGIQSFFDDDLIMMNRAHSAIESEKCLSMAMDYFENITIDLIYGIPDMSTKKWRRNLQRAFDHGVPHISSYALTVESKTALDSFIKSGKYPPLDESLAAEHFDILVAETKTQGYIQYEISNFGKPNYFSKHNISYWKGKSYLGIGPSAHSFNGTQRNWNISNNTKYIKSIQRKVLPQETEILSKMDQFNEFIMTGLRTVWGVSLAQIEVKFGTSVRDELLREAQKHIKNEMLEIKNDILFITKKGKFFADGIASDLFLIQ
jgi:oxygen-independent coproporphyrinogen-3 oxidase